LRRDPRISCMDHGTSRFGIGQAYGDIGFLTTALVLAAFVKLWKRPVIAMCGLICAVVVSSPCHGMDIPCGVCLRRFSRRAGSESSTPLRGFSAFAVWPQSLIDSQTDTPRVCDCLHMPDLGGTGWRLQPCSGVQQETDSGLDGQRCRFPSTRMYNVFISVGQPEALVGRGCT
jgi:hypothetical protein